MAEYPVTFVRGLNDKVVVSATNNPGRIKSLTVTESGELLYFVRSSTGGTDAWYRAIELVDPAPPEPSTMISSLDYFGLFTADERTAIISSDIPEVRVAVALTSAAGRLDLASPIVIDSLNQLAALNLLTVERAAHIKTGQPPVNPAAPVEPVPPSGPVIPA